MESILVCNGVDEEVGQDASETAEGLSTRTTGPQFESVFSLSSTRQSTPAGERRKKGSRAKVYRCSLLVWLLKSITYERMSIPVQKYNKRILKRGCASISKRNSYHLLVFMIALQNLDALFNQNVSPSPERQIKVGLNVHSLQSQQLYAHEPHQCHKLPK